MPVTEALDRVLEILRTTELYSPQFGAKDDDPHANDLVGGLVSVSTVAGCRLEPPGVICVPRGHLGTVGPAQSVVGRARPRPKPALNQSPCSPTCGLLPREIPARSREGRSMF